MDVTTLSRQTLGFGAQLNLVKSELDMPQRELRSEIDFPAGTKFACPRWGKLCAVHDTVTKIGGIWVLAASPILRARAVVNVGAKIGDATIINTAAVIGHCC